MEPSENGPDRDAAHHEPSPTIYPLGFAVGIAVILVGLIIDPLLIGSIGAVITIIFGFLWIRDAMHLHHEEQVAVEAEKREAAKAAAEGRPVPTAERYPRSRFLESMTVGLGALIGGIVTVPVAGFALLPGFVGQGRHKVDLGPITDFPEGAWLIATFMVDPGAGRGLAPHRVRPQQRASSRTSRASRSSPTAARTSAARCRRTARSGRRRARRPRTAPCG